MNKKIRKTTVVVLMIASLQLSICIYLKKQYVNVSFEQLLFTLIYSSNSSETVVLSLIINILLLLLFIFLFCISPLIIGNGYNLFLETKKIKIKLLPLNQRLYGLFVLLVFSAIVFKELGIFEYISYQNNVTTLYEEIYVEPEAVNISFTEKRNLIYIYLESMETTYFSKTNGGTYEYSIIPELEELAKNNLNFSNSDKLGGFVSLAGTGWTIAAMVSQSAGLPLKVSTDGNDYGSINSFLPGAISIGDILEKEGYKQVLMLGSSSKFGGRKYFYKLHGNYEILDYEWAKENNKIDKDYYAWWGYEDKKLFEFAKEKLTELGNGSESFNFTLLTADTHFPDGYLDETCEIKHNNHYENSFACSSKMVYEFITWIKEQSFYENTTIVLVGDHLGMQEDFYKNIDSSYERTIYNTFINSINTTENNKKRYFSSFDLFPTILSSIGANIEGEKLGFGTNLFSSESTILEKYGYDYFNNELNKKSDYYNEFIIKDSYKKMLK